jgi:hypothetical protein
MLDDKSREISADPNLAVMSTLMTDGSIQTHPVWRDADGENILIDIKIHLPKFENIKCDATITALLQETGNH